MRIKKRYWVVILLGLLGIASIVACGNPSEDIITKDEQDKETIEIGMSFDTFVVERWQRDRDIFVSTANDLGAEVNVQNANGDVEEQIRQIQYFIDKKVDVIVVVPIEADSLTEVIRKAKEENIKVVSYDRLVNFADVDLYLSFDNESVGHLMGTMIGKELTVGDNVIMLSGPLTDGNVSLVNAGFMEEMERAGINVLDIAYMDDWKAELAYDYVNEHMGMIRDDVQAIMCGNDNLAARVVMALSENRLAGTILVAGQDGDLDACQRIVEGTQTMTVFKPVNQLAEKAAQMTVALANDEEIVCEETIYNGTYNVPYVALIPAAVTAENIDEIIIDSGFHLKEDVYINCPEQLMQP